MAHQSTHVVYNDRQKAPREGKGKQKTTLPLKVNPTNQWSQLRTSDLRIYATWSKITSYKETRFSIFDQRLFHSQTIFYFSPSKFSKKGIKESLPNLFFISFQQRNHTNLPKSLLQQKVPPKKHKKKRTKAITTLSHCHNVARCGQLTPKCDMGNIY